ncbi:hypothetical protein TorRG33x02_126040 [Trema orientale]|uniref:Uncharacterized protein n=1 Tax=Trema orientale TaxID=63057 RepID=A0A2P5F1B0_TREOI|nr:hypothetical protein TorRG33x02_126040 [Trema orientale]
MIAKFQLSYGLSFSVSPFPKWRKVSSFALANLENSNPSLNFLSYPFWLFSSFNQLRKNFSSFVLLFCRPQFLRKFSKFGC